MMAPPMAPRAAAVRHDGRRRRPPDGAPAALARRRPKVRDARLRRPARRGRLAAGGRARCPRRATYGLPETDGAAAGAGAKRRRRVHGLARRRRRKPGERRHVGGHDDDFFSVGGSTSRSRSRRDGGPPCRWPPDTEDGGNEQLTLQQPESTGSLPKYTVTFDSETKLGSCWSGARSFAPGATSEQKKARPERPS